MLSVPVEIQGKSTLSPHMKQDNHFRDNPGFGNSNFSGQRLAILVGGELAISYAAKDSIPHLSELVQRTPSRLARQRRKNVMKRAF